MHFASAIFSCAFQSLSTELHITSIAVSQLLLTRVFSRFYNAGASPANPGKAAEAELNAMFDSLRSKIAPLA
jgi:hypothetical protein